MSRKHKKTVHNQIDIALLTCGLVDLPVFKDCVEAIKREMASVPANFYVFFNGLPTEAKQPFSEIISTTEATVRHSSERVGFSAGANRVIRMGSAPLVLFITDDIILHEGALKELTETMKEKAITLCGLKLVYPNSITDKNRPAGRVQHIGQAIDLHGEVTHPLLGWKPENKKCNISREVQSVTGGVFMVRRDAFKKANGFFEGYGLGYYEDVDLCMVLRAMGGRIYIETRAVADHYTNMSMLRSGQTPPMYQNRMLFQMRHSGRLVHDSWTFW